MADLTDEIPSLIRFLEKFASIRVHSRLDLSEKYTVKH